MMTITRIQFTAERDDDAEYTIGGGMISIEDLERSSTPVEDLAEAHYGGRFNYGDKLPTSWKHVTDAVLLRMMAFYETTNIAEAIWHECQRYAASDMIRYENWKKDNWEFQTIACKVYGKQDPSNEDEEETELSAHYCGGVESDADDYAEPRNKRYNLKPDSVCTPVGITYLLPYRTEVAHENSAECKAELEKEGYDLSDWDRLIQEALLTGVESIW